MTYFVMKPEICLSLTMLGYLCGEDVDFEVMPDILTLNTGKLALNSLIKAMVI